MLDKIKNYGEGIYCSTTVLLFSTPTRSTVFSLVVGALLGYLSAYRSEDNFLYILSILVLIFIVIIIFYYIVFFKNIIVNTERYFFEEGPGKLIEIPSLVITKDSDTLFKLQINVFNPAKSKIIKNNNTIVLVIEKSKTFSMDLNKVNNYLNQKKEDMGYFFILQQECENGNSISFSFSISAHDPKDIDKLTIYMEYGALFDQIKNNIKKGNYNPKNKFHEEIVYCYENNKN